MVPVGETAPRRYLVTGGTSGIGMACAAHLTEQGHHVWITGTGPGTLAVALDQRVAAGGSICDVTDAAQVDVAFADCSRAFGGLDGAFLNAGVDGQGVGAEDLELAAVAHVLDVNVSGVLRCAQAAYRTLTRPGALVINASVNGLRPEPRFADYNASKAAAISLASSLALEWSGEGLSVVAIAPGYVRTRMTAQHLDDPVSAGQILARVPAGRFASGSEIAATVAFLLSGAGAHLTGACIPIAGASNV